MSCQSAFVKAQAFSSEQQSFHSAARCKTVALAEPSRVGPLSSPASATHPRRRQSRRGQSTVEFMLMVPVLFAIYFFVIELGLYFTTIHYATYAAFTLARAQEGGFSNQWPSLSALDDVILTGLVWTSNAAKPVGASKYSAAGVSVSVSNFEQRVPFPFIVGLLPNMQFDAKVFLGPTEALYEGKADTRNGSLYDNNL